MRNKTICSYCKKTFTTRGIPRHRKFCLRKPAREKLESLESLKDYQSSIEKVLDGRLDGKQLQAIIDISEGEIWAWMAIWGYLPESAKPPWRTLKDELENKEN